MKFFTNLFKKVEYRILELEKSSPLPELTQDLKESLKTLQYHPGMTYLLSRLRTERATLEHHLHENFDLHEKEFQHLQAGIYWAGWLERSLTALTQVPRKVDRAVTSSELDLLDRARRDLDAHLERIG